MRATIQGRLVAVEEREASNGYPASIEAAVLVGDGTRQESVRVVGDRDADGLLGLLKAPEMAPVTFEVSISATKRGGLFVRAFGCKLSAVPRAQSA